MSPPALPTGRRRTIPQLAEEEGRCQESIRRYMRIGIQVEPNRREYLRGYKVGGRYVVYDSDWAAFVSAVSGGPRQTTTAPAATDARAARSRYNPRVEAELDAIFGGAK